MNIERPSNGMPMTERDQSNPVPSYAVLFRIHFWDDFAQRQLERVLGRVGSGDVYVIADETSGRIEGIRHDRVVRVVEQDMVDMGFPRAGTGNMLWFNGDYPLYYFLREQGAYDYYLQVEFDVVLNLDFDSFIRRAAADKADFVGLTKGEPVNEWQWLYTCDGPYDLKDVRYKLICLSLFSNRALRHLGDRRLEMAAQRRASAFDQWPICEGFLATEMARGDFVSVELQRYVETRTYDSWPPFVESDLPRIPERAVVHPLLDRDRYILSMLKVKVGLTGYLNVNSLFHRKLRRLPPRVYLSALARTFGQKAARVLRSRRVLPNLSVHRPGGAA